MDVHALQEALDDLVPEILALTGAPGTSVAVGIGHDIVVARGYGLADLDTDRPMSTETVGPTGSDAKPYTAVAAMQLVERGQLALDAPVNDYLDTFQVTNPHGERDITLRDLLTHRSGLGTTFGFCDLVPPAPLGEHLRRVFAEGRTDVYGGTMFPLWTTPVGTNYQYSNTGIALVGHLVERANPERLTFSAWVQRHLFDPLGMTSTCFPPDQTDEHVPATILQRRSTGYATLPGLSFQLPQIHIADYPAGTALTTASDHCRFLLAMANGGELQGQRILEADLAGAMITPQAPRGPDPTVTVGLVWNLFHHGTPGFYFGHGGEYMWGWNNVSRVWADQRVAVTANTNQWDLGDAGTSDRPSHQAGLLILGTVARWLSGADPRPARSMESARSYLAGVIVADRLGARLGLPTRPTASELASVARLGRPQDPSGWDAASFEEALLDHRLADTPADLFGLTRQQVPDHQRELVQRQLGVPGLGRLIAQLPE